MIVRINPLSERTPQEIEAVIASGADVIMLPYFFTPDDVCTFVTLVEAGVRSACWWRPDLPPRASPNASPPAG